MKTLKALMTALLVTTLTTMGCWWTQDEYSNNYIAFVNQDNMDNIHYAPNSDYYSSASNTFYNGKSVALPLTVHVKLTYSNGVPITKAILQYRIKRNGSWVSSTWSTVKTIDITNKQNAASLDYGEVLPIFGNGNINPRNVKTNDHIYVRFYITDGVTQSGNLEDKLNDLNLTVGTTGYTRYTGGWGSPYVAMFVYNGHKRVSW